MAWDRYTDDGGRHFDDALRTVRERNRPPVETPEEKARRAEDARVKREQELIASSQRGAGYRDAPKFEGRDMLVSFVNDTDQTVDRLVSMVSRGQLAEARTMYDKMQSIVSDNMNDLAALTRKDVAESGVFGRKTAVFAAQLLSGEYNSAQVTMPDGGKTTLGDVLSDSGAYQGFKRKALKDLGYSETVGGMYFGEYGEDAQTIARMVVEPQVEARTGGRVATDPLQRASVMNFLAERDGDSFTNLDRFTGLFGGASTNVLSYVFNTRAEAGDYRRSLESYMDIAEGLRKEGETGAALAARVNSAVGNLMQSSFAGLHEGEITARDKLNFDAALSATIRAMKSRGLAVDITRPSFASAFKGVMDQLAWAENQGIDLVGESSDAGTSYMDAVGEWVADFMSGTRGTGIFNSIQTFRDGLAGIRGARVPTHAGGPRSPGDTMQKTLVDGSDMLGLDGIAYGFEKELSASVVPQMSGGKSAADAVAAVWGDSDKLSALQTGVLRQVTRAMPMVTEEAREQIAAALLSSWYESRGTRLCVQDVVEGVVQFGEFNDERSETQLRSWLAANTDPVEEKREWQEQLKAHFAIETPNDPGRVAQRTAAAMHQVEAARLAGEDHRAVLDNYLSHGKFYVSTPYNDTDNPRPAWLQAYPNAKDFKGHISVQYTDRRKLAASLGLTPERFDADQQRLAAEAALMAQMEKSYNSKVLAEQFKGKSKDDGLGSGFGEQ